VKHGSAWQDHVWCFPLFCIGIININQDKQVIEI